MTNIVFSEREGSRSPLGLAYKWVSAMSPMETLFIEHFRSIRLNSDS